MTVIAVRFGHWQLAIDVDLLSAYYRIEQSLFPGSKASQRLLND